MLGFDIIKVPALFLKLNHCITLSSTQITIMKHKILLYWIAVFSILLAKTAAGVDIVFNIGADNYAICNGVQQQGHPATCSATLNTPLAVGLNTWGKHTTTFTLTNANPATVSLSGDCLKSWIKNSDTNWNPISDCLPPPIDPPPTATSGQTVVDEWFSDLPWHQKLSTKDSNLIDVPFVMPAAAINAADCQGTDKVKKARCMLRYGIVNVMTMHRTDTLYAPNDIPPSYNQDCSDRPCVQVKLDIQRIHSTDTYSYAAEPATNNTYDRPATGGNPAIHVASLGFAITESTIFAPWRPWYMGHYCAVNSDNISNSVCYEDYFTTQLIAATSGGETWLKDRPAIFYPQSPDNGTGDGSQYGHWCQTGSDTCSMYLGKVKFDSNSQPPIPDNCGSNCNTYLNELNSNTQSLDSQFTEALAKFVDIGRYPWNWNSSNDESKFDPTKAFITNPFIGYYAMTEDAVDRGNFLFKATTYALPKQCTQQDFAIARLALGDDIGPTISHLKDCSLDFEIHTNGFFNAWQYLYGGTIDGKAIDDIRTMSSDALDTNQYGRTMFLYAGIPEQTIPAAFVADIQGGTDSITTHDKIYGASRYTQFLPMANPADQTQLSKEYQDDFWHAFFMSNHMNQTPDHFIRGIRGRTLWHNEYRSNLLYNAEEVNFTTGNTTHFANGVLAHVDFPAGFQKDNASSPYHGNTCDSCHIRNGTGIPLKPDGNLSNIHQDVKHGMNPGYLFEPYLLDYTYTNKGIDPQNSSQRKQIVTPMKLVLFDLNSTANQCDATGHTAAEPPYSNKYMNFYGNSFHVTQSPTTAPAYQMVYTPVTSTSVEGFYLVDSTVRKPSGGTDAYTPMRPEISNVDTSKVPCNDNMPPIPAGLPTGAWPANCADVNGAALSSAIANGEIGIINLMGKRLGNSPLIEMIPDQKINDNVTAQKAAFTYAGCYGKVAGTRTINLGPNTSGDYHTCDTSDNCFISRWGWIGDRASLEDQIANAAHVEMNITTIAGYNQFHPNLNSPIPQVRYKKTLCGPADVNCQQSAPNSDITEEEVRNMATYQRWIGIPNRSRYQIATSLVVQGEKQFRSIGCSNCHVIDKIPFVYNDNMLPDEERIALGKLQNQNIPDYPFVSYLGTDLLMHDMGYLSQVAKSPVEQSSFRNADGTINSAYTGYIQKIRTPPLKGLRFNRFVTDSNHNTTSPIRKNPDKPIVPGCDFLLHDGRACDAIEAAFLHDGPAVKQLGMIGKLNQLSPNDLAALRAFLYSL